MNSGIYKITNIITNDFYIGSSSNLKRRRYSHFNALEKNRNHSKILQRSYNKYGKENFIFEILFYCPEEYNIKLEKWTIKILNPKYNICKTIPNNTTGYKHTEEDKIKMSLIASTKKLQKLYQYDNNLNLIKIWDSCKSYTSFYNISTAALSKALRKNNKCAGFIVSKKNLNN